MTAITAMLRPAAYPLSTTPLATPHSSQFIPKSSQGHPKVIPRLIPTPSQGHPEPHPNRLCAFATHLPSADGSQPRNTKPRLSAGVNPKLLCRTHTCASYKQNTKLSYRRFTGCQWRTTTGSGTVWRKSCGTAAPGCAEAAHYQAAHYFISSDLFAAALNGIHVKSPPPRPGAGWDGFT